MQGIAFGGTESNGSAVGESRPLPVATYGTFVVNTTISDTVRFADVVSDGTADASWKEGLILFGKDTAGTFFPIPLTAGGTAVNTVGGGTGGASAWGTFVQIHDPTGTALAATYGTIYGLKVHIVGDSDKCVRGNVAEGADISDPVLGGSESPTGKSAALQSNADKDLKVTLDSEAITANPGRPATPAVTQVSSSASSVTLKASNANRLGLTIQNDSTAVLYVKFGATASASSYTVKMVAGAYYEAPAPVYTGIVDGIWASATGNAYITELTA